MQDLFWKRLCIIGALIVLAGSLIWSVRTAWADQLRQQTSISALDHACAINPLEARAFAAKAQYEEQAGIDSSATWRRAAKIDPRNSRILIPAGISAEIRGNTQEAESYFLTAEMYNHLQLPRWTLANFYFRQGDMTKCLHWIHKMLERPYGNLNPAFDLAEQAGASPESILSEVLASNVPASGAFLAWISRTRLDASRVALVKRAMARYVALTKRDHVFTEGSGVVLYAANRLMEDGFGNEARSIWRDGCEANVLDCSTPPDDGLIGNGLLTKKFFSSLLDWNMPVVPGVTSFHQPGTGTLKFFFSGDQPERCELLRQTISLAPKSAWRIRFDFQTRDIGDREAGNLRWTLKEQLLPMDRTLSSEGWSVAEFRVASEEGGVLPFALTYSRAPGTTRISGELWIRNIRAERGH